MRSQPYSAQKAQRTAYCSIRDDSSVFIVLCISKATPSTDYRNSITDGESQGA